MVDGKNAVGHHVRYKDNSPILSSSTNPGSSSSTSTKSNEKDNNNIGQLLINLNDLDKKLQVSFFLNEIILIKKKFFFSKSTFHDLQQRRRYVLGAMIRQMQYTVRRIRMNVTRMQTQLMAVDNVATQIPLLPRPIIVQSSVNSSSTTSTPEFTVQQMKINKELIEEIEQRLQLTSKKINDIVIRLNQSLMNNIVESS
ncbi:hypothetical protein BLA29_011639, partial [Euroglyphus maynei]